MSFDFFESESKAMEIVCIHKDRKHFAKGLCKYCYAIKIRKSSRKKATLCQHTDKPHYSSGLCVSCYSKQLNQKKRERKQEPLVRNLVKISQKKAPMPPLFKIENAKIPDFTK